METIVCSIPSRKLVDRGFLIGPYCPIYGFGALSIILLLKRYMKEYAIFFVMSIVICSLLEYITSYFMEKIFKARWWDYSNKRFNINGRICLTNSIAFGIIATVIMYLLNPKIEVVISKISESTLYIMSAIFFAIFVIDYIVSSRLMFSFKDTLAKVKLDNTEEITERIKEILKEKSFFTRRIVQAFPNVKVKIDHIKEKVASERENLRKEIEKLKKLHKN